jgi:Domain of unknown function (DUF6908)
LTKLKTVASVADVLERELEPTIKEWLRRVNLVPELFNIPLSDADRTSSISMRRRHVRVPDTAKTTPTRSTPSCQAKLGFFCLVDNSRSPLRRTPLFVCLRFFGCELFLLETDNRSLQITVKALIDSGPQARRSAVSFFQDGEYQERIFREIESRHPDIEHLGNWHTHHMNGLQHLSSGDLATYHRIVNHPNHNTDFFYALLVTTKRRGTEPLTRYEIKHYLFRRNDPKAYEIPARAVQVVDEPDAPIRERVQVAPAQTTPYSCRCFSSVPFCRTHEDAGRRPQMQQGHTSTETLLDILKRAGRWKPGLYLKIENAPYMALVIEATDESGPSGLPAISVAHYGEQNGDLMRVPELG